MAVSPVPAQPWHLREAWGCRGDPGWPSPSPVPVHVLVPTCVLAQQLLAGAVAGFGGLHASRLVRQGENLGEAELAVPAPPALAARTLPQPHVLGRDLPPDAQLVGDVAAALCKSEGGSGWVGGTGLPVLPVQPVPAYLGSAGLPSTARPSPAPRPRCGRPAGRCCGRQRAPAPPCSSRLGRSAPATPRSPPRPPGQSCRAPSPACRAGSSASPGVGGQRGSKGTITTPSSPHQVHPQQCLVLPHGLTGPDALVAHADAVLVSAHLSTPQPGGTAQHHRVRPLRLFDLQVCALGGGQSGAETWHAQHTVPCSNPGPSAISPGLCPRDGGWRRGRRRPPGPHGAAGRRSCRR